MNNKYRQLASNTIVFAIGSFGSKLFLFLLVPLYTNVLSTSEYGISDLVINIGKLTLPVISLTIYDSIFPFGLSGEHKPKDIFLNVTIVFVISTIFTIILAPLWDLYHPVREWKWYLVAYIVSSFALENHMLYLKVNEKNKLYSGLCIVQSLSLVLCNIITLLVWKLGVSGYLLSLIVSNIFTTILAIVGGKVIIDLKTASFNKKLLEEMIRYSAPLIISSVLWWIMHSSDKIMIEWLLGSASLGLYSAASKIPSLIGTITSIFNQAWGISAIREFNSSNEKNFYSNVFQLFYVLLFCSGMVIIMISKPFMTIYVGKSFEESWIFVPVLILGAVYSSIVVFINAFFTAMKRSKNVMWSTLVAGIINIIVNYLLIPLVGVQGATIGTATAYLVLSISRLVDLKRYINFKYNVPKLTALTLLSLGQTIVVIALKDSLLFSIPFVIVLIIFCRNDIKSVLNQMYGFIKKKLGRTVNKT